MNSIIQPIKKEPSRLRAFFYIIFSAIFLLTPFFWNFFLGENSMVNGEINRFFSSSPTNLFIFILPFAIFCFFFGLLITIKKETNLKKISDLEMILLLILSIVLTLFYCNIIIMGNPSDSVYAADIFGILPFYELQIFSIGLYIAVFSSLLKRGLLADISFVVLISAFIFTTILPITTVIRNATLSYDYRQGDSVAGRLNISLKTPNVSSGKGYTDIEFYNSGGTSVLPINDLILLGTQNNDQIFCNIIAYRYRLPYTTIPSWTKLSNEKTLNINNIGDIDVRYECDGGFTSTTYTTSSILYIKDYLFLKKELALPGLQLNTCACLEAFNLDL